MRVLIWLASRVITGAGKSSLLDAITWVLFGKARRSDDGVINNTCDEAEVIYQFIYENAFYRVQRIKARNRSVVLEFQMKGDEDVVENIDRTQRGGNAKFDQ